MQSTGEVACFGADQYEAYLKGLLSANFKLPPPGSGILLSIGGSTKKELFAPYAELLQQMGFTLYATEGTFAFLQSKDVKVALKLNDPLSKEEPNVATFLSERKIALTLNAPSSLANDRVTAGFHIRRMTVDRGAALVVDLNQAMLLVDSLYQKAKVEAATGGSFFTIEPWRGMSSSRRGPTTQ
jgi:carbamoyl-phosphate synthase/aspartate carbamoyltransferase